MAFVGGEQIRDTNQDSLGNEEFRIPVTGISSTGVEILVQKFNSIDQHILVRVI